jgi:hypothetical protein
MKLPEDYRMTFTKTHIELPYYFAREGGMVVTVTTVDGYNGAEVFSDDGKDVGILGHVPESFLGKWYDHVSDKMRDGGKYDVVVHWRKWFPEFYRPEAINVINCQDHSFSHEWKSSVVRAYAEKKLYGILCFPTWHKQNLFQEMGGNIDGSRLIDGLTLGVDTEMYFPAPNKDPYALLWASDPGRGLTECLKMFCQLFRMDPRFRLHVCYPDYVQKVEPVVHPGVVWHGNVPNGGRLQNLFNYCGILPYTSTFMEPSSRAHRQAQAAESLVLYPPGRGSPSQLIEHMRTGVVSDPSMWPPEIIRLVESGEWKKIGQQAREYAVSENWSVQAKRFREYFEGVIGR